MHARVLGSAAGGGFPQWNCGCAGCAAARAGQAAPRAETCIAIPPRDGSGWLVFGAPAAIAGLVARDAALAPTGARGTRIGAILLANGDLDQTLGLLTLRESQPLRVISTATVRRGFCVGNVLARTLQRTADQLRWDAMEIGEPRALAGWTVEAIEVPAKVPLHLHGTATPGPEDGVAYLLDDGAGRAVAVAPGVGGPCAGVDRLLDAADVVFFDGSFWSDDELAHEGAGARRARDMAHWPLGGPEGSLQRLARARGRVILVHVNNTNPILREDTAERRAVEAAGVTVAHDGMEVPL